ncbi:MAG: hypothetical protein JHC95_02630 [Solirubrobacteraceae bacterium]|nr:hypothetical protein [Solirubrobacteraceae bacterium]
MTELLDLRRPRDLSALVGETFRVWAGHAPVFLALAFVFVAPAVILVDGIWVGAWRDPEATNATADAVSQVLFTLVIPPLITAVHVVAVVDLSEGRAPAVGRSLRAALALALPLVAATCLYTLLVGIGLIALIIPGIWLGVACYFTAQHVAYERTSAVTAVRESMALVTGHWWWTFGVLLVVGLLLALSGGMVGLVGVVAGVIIGGVAGGVILIVTMTIVQTALYSLGALAGTLLYFSLRAQGDRDVPVPAPGPFGPVPERP